MPRYRSLRKMFENRIRSPYSSHTFPWNQHLSYQSRRKPALSEPRSFPRTYSTRDSRLLWKPGWHGRLESGTCQILAEDWESGSTSHEAVCGYPSNWLFDFGGYACLAYMAFPLPGRL